VIEAYDGVVVVKGLGPVMPLGWRCHYSNSLEDAELTVEIFDGYPKLPGVMVFDEPTRLHKMQLAYDLVRPGIAAWVSEGASKREFSSNELAEYLLKRCMDEAERMRRRRG